MILLIWEEVPDNKKAFIIPTNSDFAKLVVLCAGKYINGDDLADDDPIWQLNEAVQTMTPLEDGDLFLGSFESVVFCGMLL